MANAVWMLELGRTDWQLYAGRESGNALVAAAAFAEGELASQVEPIAAALAGDGRHSEPIVVALESSLCLAATIPIERPQELRDRQTMLYRLEEWIPWGTEDFIADFSSAEGIAIAVAVRREPLAEFLQQLEMRGISVQSVLPLSLLVALEHAQHGLWPPCHLVAVSRSGRIDLLSFESGAITQWQSLSAVPTGVRQELERLAVEAGAAIQLVSYELDHSTEAGIDNLDFVQRLEETDTVDHRCMNDMALAASEKLLQGSLEAPIDLKRAVFGLRRGNFALRRHAVALECVAAILIFSAIAALLYRGHIAGSQAQLAAAKQADVFRSVFPNSRVPVGVATRLRSELAKLQGLRGEDATLPSQLSALGVLERLLKAVPRDKRFRLLEIRIEEGRLYLDGETRVHSDAETIAQRLRGEGFDVSPPKSQRLDDQRVSLRITGTLSPKKSGVRRPL